jgi:hypothetical protein
MVGPMPMTIKITPEVPATSRWPHLVYILDVNFILTWLFEYNHGIFRKGVERFRRRTRDAGVEKP